MLYVQRHYSFTMNWTFVFFREKGEGNSMTCLVLLTASWQEETVSNCIAWKSKSLSFPTTSDQWTSKTVCLLLVNKWDYCMIYWAKEHCDEWGGAESRGNGTRPGPLSSSNVVTPPFIPSEAPPWDSRPVSGAGVVHYHSLHRPRSVPMALGPAPLVTSTFLHIKWKIF